jgi:hypothetical protein
MKALSVRQPWAWAIIYAGKDIENRSENMATRLRKSIGQTIYIHAGASMDQDALVDLEDMSLLDQFIKYTEKAAQVELGGVVGTVRISEIVNKHPSMWFTGPYGIVLVDPKPVKFQPGKGQLGLFEWTPRYPNPR